MLEACHASHGTAFCSLDVMRAFLPPNDLGAIAACMYRNQRRQQVLNQIRLLRLRTIVALDKLCFVEKSNVEMMKEIGVKKRVRLSSAHF